MLNDIFFCCDTFFDQIFPSYFYQNHKNKNFEPSLLHGTNTWIYIHPSPRLHTFRISDQLQFEESNGTKKLFSTSLRKPESAK